MSTRVHDGSWALSEKEKQTLRLIVRGHDAKSIARSLDLSVHTINERLRDARRKMAVSSSREAARLLLAAEGGPQLPELLGDIEIGEDAGPGRMDQGAGRPFRRPRIIIGVLLMTLALGLLAFAAMPQLASTAPPAPVAASVTPDAAVVDTARQFLVLLDQGRWEESYQAFAPSFRTLNTLQVWTDVSKQVRAPLGAVISRTLVSQETVAAPPHGYEVVKFRTRFANRELVEVVTLKRADGAWLVVGVMVD
jgi:DNA-binding CsgD family transcriptional regulator